MRAGAAENRLIEDFESAFPMLSGNADWAPGMWMISWSYLREAVSFADTDDRLSFHGATALYVLEREVAA